MSSGSVAAAAAGGERQGYGCGSQDAERQSHGAAQGHGEAGCPQRVGRTLARCCLGEEIAEQLMAALGEHAFGMELHSLQVLMLAVA